MQEWGLRGRLKSFLLDAFSQEIGFSCEDIVLERSHSPDFGDYFSTTPIAVAPQLQRSPNKIAEIVAARLNTQAADWVSRAEARENGFVNMFTRYAAAATALLELDEKLAALLLPDAIATDEALTYVTSSSDKRLQVVSDVLHAINAFLHNELPPPPTRRALTTLCEPEEMDLILQLHEISRIMTQRPRSRHGTIGYLYVTSVKFRDGFMWGKRIAPFWVSKGIRSPIHEARKFLVGITRRILLLGISLVRRSDETA
jgi:hypothetical protein